MSIYTNDLQSLYIAYFNRPGDTSGMAFWEAALASGRATLADVRAAFATADEYKAEYANKTNAQVISQVYMNLFGRLPDLAGLEFWTTKMAEGVVTIDQVVAQVAAGAQNQDKIAFESKTQAAVAFTAALDDIKEVLAYETAAGQAIAKNYISGVKDAATLASSTTTAALDALTAQIVKAANLDDATRTVSLTNDIDLLTANVFNSVPTYTPGGDEFINSLQDEDVLIGAGDNPTLNLTLGTANDGAETEIAPTLIGIETINARISGSAGATDGGTVTALNLADASGLKTINVERITGNAPEFEFRELDASVNNIKLANATNTGTVTFTHKEEVLTGTSEALDVTLTNVRNHAVNFQEGGDLGADTGFYFENINVVAAGTNDIDTLTFQSNGREDLVAGNDEDTTKQTLTITAGAAAGAAGSFEVNVLNATGVDTMTIHANHRVDIAADKAAALSAGDGLNTADLERLNIDGAANVRIDGLEGQVAAFGDTKGLTVAAGTMTGNLRVGVTGGTSGDDLFALTSGSGNDEIRAFGNLGGDVATQDGNDTVVVSGNMLGTASINAGEGNNVVTAADMLGAAASDRDLANNGGFDDIQAATIVTGSGNDVVTVRDLLNQADWDNITITDGNNNDQQFIVGAMVDTGAGNDTINFRSVAEGAMVQAGEGDDIVNVALSNVGTVLAGDSQANRATLVTATSGVATGRTDEVNRDGTVNRLGAIVDLGAGTADVANFTEVDLVVDTDFIAPAETTVSTTLIVGQDAELRGAETVNVTALDRVNVTTTTTTVDQDGVTTGVQNDINANVIGTQNLNLTILNQIEDNVDDAVVAHTTIDGAVVNDNNATDGHIYADVMRFDSALQNIALVSQEAALQTGSATEVYEAGTRTEFSLDNMRSGINLSLRANEATGVAAGALRDDSQLVISSTTGLVTTNAAAADVRLNLNYDNARGLNDAAVLNVDAASGAFDLDLRIGATVTDVLDTDGDGNSATVANAASTTDDDTMRIENFTVNFADANSHSINANGFGDVVFRGATDRPAAVAGDVSSTAATSFTVNSAAAAGSTIAIDNVNADVIRVNNAAGTAVTAANVVVRVNANNNYDIRTGTGTDVIDMRADDVRSDDNATALDRADRIDAGTGRDTMIVSGTDNLGQNILPAITTTVDDDVFATLRGIEKILVDSDAAAGVQQITLDEQATTTGVDTIALVGAGNQTQRIVIGNNFVLANNTGDNANGQLTTAASAFVVDASMHTGMSSIAIESKDDDTDVALVNLDLRANSVGGANVNLVNTGDPSARVELRLTAAHEDDGFSLTSAVVAGGDGNVGLQVAAGNVDKIVISDMAGVSTVSHADATVTTAAEGAMTVNIDASWTGAAFELDMSGVADTDANQATGGATIRAAYGDTATLNIKGTANADNIIGGRGADVIDGGAGNDIIVGDEVTLQNELEVVTFAANYDGGDVITITHGGTTQSYTVAAGGETGAAVAAVFAARVWGSATAAVDAASRQLRLTGTTEGIDYVASATVNNDNDTAAAPSSTVLAFTGSTDPHANIRVTVGGQTYDIIDLNSDSSVPAGVPAALLTALGATSATVAATATGIALTFSRATGGDIADITAVQVLTGPAMTYTLTETNSTAPINQVNPQFVTETQARTVLGGADTINGGAGNDTIAGLTGADILDGGAGVDTLDYSLSLGGVTVDIAANTASGGDAQGDVISNFESIVGSAYNDVLTGNSLDNLLAGGAGNDTISGGAGVDTIFAGVGADIVTGGTGNDIIDLGADTARDIVRFASGDGVDTVTNFLSTAVDMSTTDQIQFTDFADRDLIPTSLLQQTAAGNANAVISGASTELLMVTGATTFVGGVTTANVAAALGAAFDMTALADGRTIFAIQVDTDGNGTTETVVGYYTDVGADDVIDAGNIEILGVVNGAVGTDNFWLPTV